MSDDPRRLPRCPERHYVCSFCTSHGTQWCPEQNPKEQESDA